MQIPETFKAPLAKLKQSGVLQTIQPQSLGKYIVKTVGEISSVNLCVLSCCDGHQFMHVTQHTQSCCEQAKRELGLESLGEDCFHWKSENGGPFVLSVPELRTRMYKGRVNDVELNTLAALHESMDLKKLDVVLLIAHMQCGKVHDMFKTPEEYCAALAKAKLRVMDEFQLPSARVISWLQVRGSDRSIYHLDHSTATALAA